MNKTLYFSEVKISCFTVLLSLVLAFLVTAQDFNGKHKVFNHKNGLSDNYITALAKDANSFLWIATKEGLNRYDGHEFLHIYNKSDNSGIPSNTVSAIEVMDKDHLAVGTTNGLGILNTNTLKSKNYSFPSYKNWERYGSLITDLLYNSVTKELWVGTGLGIFVLDSNCQLSRSLMSNEESLKNSGGYFVTRFFIGPSNNVSFLTRNEMLCYADFKNRRLVNVDEKSKKLPVNELIAKGYDCIALRRDTNKTIFTLSVRGGLHIQNRVVIYDAVKDETTQFSLGNFGKHIIENVTFPPDKRLFNAVLLNDTSVIINPYYDYPFLYNTNTKQLRPLSDDPLYFSSWPDGISAVYLKDEHNLWIGSSDKLIQFSLKDATVQPLQEVNKMALQSPGTIYISDAVYHGNKLFLAAMSYGLYSYDTITGKAAKHYPPGQGFATKNVTLSLLAFDKDNLWITTSYGALNFHIPSQRFSLIQKKGKHPAIDESNNQIFRDSKGLIWIGFSKGVACFDRKTDSFTNYYNEYNGGALPLPFGNYFTEDHESNIWMTNSSGLMKWIRKENKFERIRVLKNKIDYSPSAAIAFDREHGLYYTSKSCLVHYDIVTGAATIYTIHDGMISANITEITTDKKGNAWIGTQKGLNYFDKTKKTFINFTTEDGLLEEGIGCVKIIDTNTNKLLIGFYNSVCIFYPDKYRQQQYAPRNIITRITINNEPVFQRVNHEFPFYRNNVGFEFTGVNFDEGQLNEYAYMLEGYDTAWQVVQQRKSASYINLPPGTYLFKVKSANRQNIWNETPATFAFTIKPPFWKTTPFYIAMALLAVAMLTVAFYLQRRRILKKEAEKRRLSTIMSELRMKALRSQLNPHFIFNALNSIQYFIMDNNTEEAARYLSRFAKLFRLVLENSEDSFIPLQKELEWLRHYIDIEALRFNDRFEYSIEVENPIDPLHTLIPSMLIQPHIENAILHGLLMKDKNGRLLISFTSVTDRIIQCVIEDNGIGRAAARIIKEQKKQTHESRGMDIIKKRMEILKSRYGLETSCEFVDLYDENNNPAGTKAILMIPVAEKNHLTDEL